MTARTVNQSGGPAPDYSTLNAAVAASTAADTIEIQGTWSAADTTSVVWNVAVTVTADSSSKQIGKPWVTGGTEYRHKEGSSGHAFTVTADVNITNINIQSDSTTDSDELFRSAGNNSITCVNCMLGFTGAQAEQDIVYSEDTNTKTYSFEQCFFYDVGRSIVDIFYNTGDEATTTVNFNSCSAINIGAVAGRSSGGVAGFSNSPSSGSIFNVNSHSCLWNIDTTNATGAFASDTTPVLNVDSTYCITNDDATSYSQNDDTEDVTGTGFSYTFVTNPTTGNQVGWTNVTSGTYDPTLVVDADNDAVGYHAVVTDAGLTIPDLDILGQTRDKATPLFDPGIHALSLAAAGGGAAYPRHRTMNLVGISA